jgi:DNA-directed RNA polymerase beta' subunit
MQIKLLDIESLIRKEGLLQVSDPIYFTKQGLPTEDGLFSNKIFGNLGTPARKNRFSYINLNGIFIQPLIAKLLMSLDKNIDRCINGQGFFSVVNGKLVPDEEKGGTGIEHLYKIYDELKFSGRESEIRKSKVNLIDNLKKTDIFITKFPVIPAFLRDYNPSSEPGRIADVDEINDMYSKIIRMSNTLSGSSFSFISTATKAGIQNEMIKIYSYLTESLAHKNGLIKRSLIGKSVDYATRSVITAPRFTSDTWQDQQVRFGYTGIPLSQAAVLFYPFFVKYINDFIDAHRKEFTEIKVGSQTIFIDDIEDQFSGTMINKMVDNFIKDGRNRFQSIKVHDKKGKEYPVSVYREQLGRNFTVTDLLFLAATDICSDKHVYVTRYPVENYRVPRCSIT